MPYSPFDEAEEDWQDEGPIEPKDIECYETFEKVVDTTFNYINKYDRTLNISTFLMLSIYCPLLKKSYLVSKLVVYL